MKSFFGNLIVTNKFFNLPEAYGLWSAGHIVQICIMAALLVGCWFLFRKKQSWQNVVLWILFAISFVTMGNMVGFCIVTGINNPEWYMPFHICNLFVFVLFFMALFKGKIRDFLSDYAFYFGFLGCVFAIVIPGTSQLYFAPFHFLSLNMWLYHLVIGVLSIYLLSSGVYKVKFSNLWRMLIVLVPLLIVAFTFNCLWDTNFCFINSDKYYYPLNMLANFFGQYWTLVVVAIIIGVSCFLMAASFVAKTIKDRLISRLIAENPILVYIKENGLFDDEVELFQSLMQNAKVRQYLSEAKIVLDEAKLFSCWDAVKDDIKNMTIGQMEDISYIFHLIRKSKILNVILEQIKITQLKKLIKLLRNLPVGEILKEIKEQYGISTPVNVKSTHAVKDKKFQKLLIQERLDFAFSLKVGSKLKFDKMSKNIS